MSKNYLDKTGLTKLWEKITDGLTAKQNKITYGPDEPTGGVDSDLYLMTEPDDAVDKVGDLSTLVTEDKSSVVAAINENLAVNDSALLFDKSKRIEPTLSVGGHQASYGGCYYYKIGTKVHLHVGLNGLTANTLHTAFTLPVGYRPDSYITNRGSGGTATTESFCQVSSAGAVMVRSADTYALVDLEYDAVQ